MSTATADRAMRGYGLAHDEGEAFWLLGMLQTVKVGRADTNGSFGLLEIVVPPGHGSPWHVHPEEDEWFYVLAGNFTFYVGDTRLDLTAGGFAFGPGATRCGAGPDRAGAGEFRTDAVRGFTEVGQVRRRVPLVGPASGVRPFAVAQRNGMVVLGLRAPPGR